MMENGDQKENNMAIKIKRGAGVPQDGNLEEYQLGYDTEGKRLYIKDDGNIVKIGASTGTEILVHIPEEGGTGTELETVLNTIETAQGHSIRNDISDKQTLIGQLEVPPQSLEDNNILATKALVFAVDARVTSAHGEATQALADAADAEAHATQALADASTADEHATQALTGIETLSTNSAVTATVDSNVVTLVQGSTGITNASSLANTTYVDNAISSAELAKQVWLPATKTFAGLDASPSPDGVHTYLRRLVKLDGEHSAAVYQKVADGAWQVYDEGADYVDETELADAISTAVSPLATTASLSDVVRDEGLASALSEYTKTADLPEGLDDVVTLSGAETITGVKLFTAIPTIIVTESTDNHSSFSISAEGLDIDDGTWDEPDEA